MSEFEKIAEKLIAISKKAIQLIKTKNEYAKSINYQISQLFTQLGESSQQQDIHLLETANIQRQLSSHQLNILFCRDNRQSSYITPEDLCTFLHISKHNLKQKNAINHLELSFVNQFYSLLESQEQIEEDLINALSQTNLETWFAEVDFFNNGYIDTSALYEYFMHYDSKQQTFEEYNALTILKIIKRHNLSDKLFLQDFKHFLQRNDVIHAFLTNQQLSPVQSIKVQQNEIEKHIKHKSNQLYSLQSQISISPEIKIGAKLAQKNSYHNHFQTLSLMSREHIQQEMKQKQSITFQQRLIKLHARNEKYIREAKRQMEGIIPICNIQIQSHMQVQTFKSNSAQLIRSIRLFGDIYNRIVKLIQVFLSKNVKFTFINAFSLLDVDENNAVDLKRWKQFAKEYEINVSIKKATTFFNCYSSKGIMNYSNFLKIFKYYSLQDEYVRCSMRYPLIYEKWSDDLTENYKIFMTKIIRLIQQRQAIIGNVQKQQEQLQILLKSFSFIDEITQILGQQYRQFVRQYFQQQKEQLICKILSNTTNLL